MRILIRSKRGLLALGAACIGAAVAFALASASLAAPAPLFGSGDATNFGIVLDDGPTTVSAPVNQSEAVTAAIDVLQPAPGEHASIFHGRAWEFQDGPLHTAWIVVYPGGRQPSYGPAGHAPGVTRYRGAIIDDQTGIVLRWFSLTDPAGA